MNEWSRKDWEETISHNYGVSIDRYIRLRPFTWLDQFIRIYQFTGINHRKCGTLKSENYIQLVCAVFSFSTRSWNCLFGCYYRIAFMCHDQTNSCSKKYIDILFWTCVPVCEICESDAHFYYSLCVFLFILAWRCSNFIDSLSVVQSMEHCPNQKKYWVCIYVVLNSVSFSAILFFTFSFSFAINFSDSFYSLW